MNRIILLIMLSFIVFSSKAQNIFSQTAEMEISLDELKTADFSNKDKTKDFILQKVISKASNLNLWATDASYNELEESAIIFIRHGYDTRRLNPTEDLDKLSKDINTRRDNITKASLFLDEVKLNIISDEDFNTLINISELFDDELRSKLSSIKFSSTFKINTTSRDNLISIIEKSLEKSQTDLQRIQKNYDNVSPVIVEEKETITSILHRDQDEWSEYLLNTKKILIVLLGGESDIQKASIEIENTMTEFQGSFNDLKDLANQLKIGLGSTDKIRCKAIQIKNSSIKPPSLIKISHNSFKETIQLKIHESGHFNFKVGVSATQVQKNNFKIQNQQLVVNLNDSSKKEWKENLIVVLEGSFVKRDYDRFSSIFKNSFNTKIKERFGFFAGCKLSTRPWDILTGGLSFAISKDISLNGGISLLFQEKEQTLEIGSITSLEEARKLADKNYSNPRLFLGITFAPKIVTKALGLKEKDEK